MSDLTPLASITAADRPAVGGKGLSLGQLVAAGLPVPPGFVVTTAAFRRLQGQPLDGEFCAALIAEYERLGGGAVAVRSSATTEDGSVASFAGQAETVLGVGR